MTKKQTPKATRRKKVSTKSTQPVSSVDEVGKPRQASVSNWVSTTITATTTSNSTSIQP